jgi:cysteinyl-tRNA synthetase
LPLNDAIRKVTETTANQFHQDVAALGCLEPTIEPRATDNIAQMIAMIESLVKKGHAYVAEGEVLFDVASMADYGQLSGRNLEDQQAGARVAVDEHKRNAGDFVLWKQSSAEEPGWDSPWGRGRPGWHIECSAMSSRFLGKEFDIHGGGLDLIFPHHENEIAQSRCAHNTGLMARVWMHNGFLEVEGEKMSKSLGNFITIHELLETDKFGGQKWHGLVVRLAMLMTHYRKPIDWTADRLFEARDKVYEWNKLCHRSADNGAEIPATIVTALADDMNTPEALAHVSALQGDVSRAKGDELAAAASKLRAALEALGLRYEGNCDDLLCQDLSGIDNATIDSEIATRLAAIKEKDWGKADEIRDQLAQKGIQLKDGKDSKTGERITTWEIKR